MIASSTLRAIAGALVLSACGSCGKSDDSSTPSQKHDAGDAGGGSGGTPPRNDAGVDANEAGPSEDAASDVSPDAPLPACPIFTEAASPGNVQFAEITETSGVVASENTPDVLFLHNDSGDSARFFALTTSGQHLAIFTLTGASAVDWEDMASANGQLYLGDIGDNAAARVNVQVYRVAEPSIPATPSSVALGSVETFTFTYPEGARDAETMFVDPTTGDLYIVQKKAVGPAGVYRKAAPLASGELELVAQVDFGPLATGGDMSKSGDAILIRTYTQAWLFRRSLGMSVAEALKGEPCSIPLHSEPQGESIGFSADDQAYFTISEGANQPIHQFVKQ